MSCLLAIDQGTTSTRAIVFDEGGVPLVTEQQEFPQHYPRAGWVEHDPEDLWRSTLDVTRAALARAAAAGREVLGLGITNQRETAVLWERRSGRPLHPAIVWQDRRTAPMCRELLAAGHGELVRERTGLVVDPYFSATKIAWLLEQVPGAREAAARGELAFGTVDSFLLWRLTGGRVHATDVSNASRTMLFDIHRLAWDEDILALLGIPAALLPEVRASCAAFGSTEPGLLERSLPVAGMAGDQQAAAVGQACFEPGMAKSTLGTGCFILMNTGTDPVASANRLLTTLAAGTGGDPAYALEGSIFVAGAAVQWLRDALGVIGGAGETEALAAGLEDNGGVYMVPAFTGLGAPWWDPEARGAVLGLTRAAGAAHLARAALEAVCYQTADLVQAMRADSGRRIDALRVDGGMAANDWLLQFMADVLEVPVERPAVTETTALGAACLAGLGLGVYDSPAELGARWRCEARFTPAMDGDTRRRLLEGWQDAVARVRSAG